MTWYGNYNQSIKQLDVLLDSKPSLATLLLSPDFISQLRAFNPKLLDYISNSNLIPSQIVTYISVPPLDSQSIDRKYKLPCLAIEMVQTQTICIINSFFKPYSQNTNCFQQLFQLLKQKEVLPILAGYFNRANLAVFRSKYKEAIQSIYSSVTYLQLLIQNSDNQAISFCLPLYLCIEMTKNIGFSQQKTAIQITAIKTILQKIETQKQKKTQQSFDYVQNLCFTLREIIQKGSLNLILNGKQMIQVIFQQKYVQMFMQMMHQNNQHSFSAMNMVLSFLKYYSMSSLNSEEGIQELARKNMEILQNQPFVKVVLANFQPLLLKVSSQPAISIYGYGILQVLCHCITLSSQKILNIIKQSRLFPNLIDLLFINENCNILHKLIERAFLHIFSTERAIYQKYKSYLFCQISVIDLTAKRLLQLFPDGLEKAKVRGYFGILMKIIKIYSSLSTTNVQIRQAITSKSEIWNKITKKIIKPYQAICKQEIGQLENVTENAPVQYTVKRQENQFPRLLLQNNEAVEQIKRQEQTMPKTLELTDIKKQTQTLSEAKTQDEAFFKSPLDDSNGKKKNIQQSKQVQSAPNPKQNISKIEQTDKKQESGTTRMSNYSDFINKRKIQVSEQIKTKRSQSGQKRLSADKNTRLTSPSLGRKKNSWKDDSDEKKEVKQKEQVKSIAKDLPKIPLSGLKTTTSLTNLKNLAKSTVQEVSKPAEDDNKRILSLSMANLETLKKTTIIRIKQQPSQKKYRKARSKDKALFAYLGINIANS